jgi:hypothetical protein
MSGFFVIQESHSVYVPFKGRPEQVRLRVSEEMRKGTVFMAFKQQQTLVLEDVLVWKGELVWTCKTFPERWFLLNKFFTNHVALDLALQRMSVRPVTFVQPTTVPAFESKSVLEWIPHAPGQRRLLFVPNGEDAATEPVAALQSAIAARLQPAVAPSAVIASTTHAATSSALAPAVTTPRTSAIVAKRDASGPDVFQLWRGSESLGMALIRTMAISKALRIAKGEEISVEVTFNGKFNKWEIINVTPS